MLKVIVVEDSDALRRLLCSIVASIPGLSVVGEFIGASSAIAAIRRATPDIVLLDIQLGEGNGAEVMRVIAHESLLTKVIVVSNFADAIYRRHFADAGAFAFFDKSFELDAVRFTLEFLADAAHLQSRPAELPATSGGGESFPFREARVETS